MNVVAPWNNRWSGRCLSTYDLLLFLPGEEVNCTLLRVFPFNKQSSAAHKVGVFLIECIDSFSQTLNKYIADAPV